MAQRVARDWRVHGSRAGTVALNDAILLKSAAHCLLAEFFRGRRCYEAVTHLLVDAAENINIGKQLELSTAGRGGQVVSRLFTRQHYDMYSLGKAGYGYFYVPFMAALHMAGITDPVVLEAVKVILIKLGMLQQLQNDFQDCFREPAQSDGDDRCDIAEGKCTWLAVSALERADDNQRSLFESCYGHKDTDKVLEVKKIYEDLELPSLFRKVNAAMEDSIHGHVWSVSHAVPAHAFRLVWSSPIADGSNGTTRQDGHRECVQNS
ncbi:farnesyl pyrophosphate synthase-like [Bacillus rossius redtenbacheri]|uniref:farnesyl pyrophosphate synthase-like n=1 Tax=Bacillus rossius redtenbacheri TaxID=93214 RepID=UPI002FDEBAF3